jgi:hypothetical protein
MNQEPLTRKRRWVKSVTWVLGGVVLLYLLWSPIIRFGWQAYYGYSGVQYPVKEPHFRLSGYDRELPSVSARSGQNTAGWVHIAVDIQRFFPGERKLETVLKVKIPRGVREDLIDAKSPSPMCGRRATKMSG